MGWRSERARGWAALGALMLGYAALFAAYYPPVSAVADEAGFVNQALVWSRGAISAEGAGYAELLDFDEARGRHVALRHPGRSLVALPFLVLGGVRATFASGLLIHLAMTAVGAAALVRLGRSPLWAALLLFHPTMALYSRTIMGDEAAGAAVLLAALATTATGAAAGAWAGLAVGLAALMRYQAALALPSVAAAFLVPRGRPRPWRDAALCLLTAGVAGSLLVAYNLAVYGRPFDANPNMRGSFSPRYLPAQVPFYVASLMLIWPGQLLAPALDRSRLRWLARGVCGTFLAFFCFYYFHDSKGGWLETLVLGQRLLQVALPVWVVSYAGVVDDRLAAPLRRRLGERAWAAAVALGCAGLLVGTGLMFARHQAYLARQVAVRDAMVAAVPEGALVVHSGPIRKFFGIPTGLPSYRWRLLQFQAAVLDHSQELAHEDRPWYLVVMPDEPGEPTPAAARAMIGRYRMEPVPARDPLLTIHVARPGSGRR